MGIEIRYTVLNPEAGVERNIEGYWPGTNTPPITNFKFAKRLGTLENKTIYLVDTGFGGSYNFMLQLQKWFRNNMPTVTTIRKRKPGNVFADDNDELWDEIKAKGDAIVMGVAG